MAGLLAVVALASCGRGARATQPPVALVGFRGAPTVELDLGAVAADALQPSELAGLLEEAGFVGAAERAYTQPGTRSRRVVVRVLRFSHPAGAERYLAWLRSHPSEVVGEATAIPWGSGPAFVHEPGGCCPKEQPLLLGAWRVGPEVVRVIATGPGIDGPEGRTLLDRIHAELRVGR